MAYLGCKLLQPVPDYYQYLSINTTTASYNSSHSNLNAASYDEQSQSTNQKSNGNSNSQFIKEVDNQRGNDFYAMAIFGVVKSGCSIYS